MITIAAATKLLIAWPTGRAVDCGPRRRALTAVLVLGRW
ncbi:hypothetical protein I553_3815 [Mycobacterium xenopi 4042]|uniref:Uncharacterized protein n=1 Tax=Mycobacterium xenopi 4042 TaxID=1299334 RepID=X8A223_MYCXE|nr:hypothetical protein I553_3815 [Mycobacterium xenopi 4042]